MRKLLTLFNLLFILFIAHAQEIEVTGTVLDRETREPVPGAFILLQGTSVVAETDFDGTYAVKAAIGKVLQFSYVGYLTKDVVVRSSTIDVELEIDTEESFLNEIVIIGYGEKRRELVSGSYSSLEPKEIVKNNPLRVEQALQGRTAGVQVSSNSGSPGSAYNIRIRGITTNGDNSPLVIVDGVQIGPDLSIIDPNDIEKIDIIKDASTAIYGVRGANGVILITTKSGNKDTKTRFTYSSSLTLQETTKRLDLLKGLEYAALVNETVSADGGAIPYQLQNITSETDWQQQLFETSPMINHYIGATGGGEKYTFNISGSFLDQKGIIAPDKSNFSRWTVKSNLGLDLTEKLRLNTLLLYTNNSLRTIPEGGRGSILYYATNASPLTSIFDGTDGTGPSRGFSYIGTEQGNEIVNPFAVINNTYNKTKVNRFTGKLELEYDILESLKATSRFNYNYSDVVFRQYQPLAYYGQNKVVNTVQLDPVSGLFNLDRNNDGDRDVYSRVNENSQNFFSYIFENFINYDFSFNDGDHNFQTMLGLSITSEQSKANFGSGFLLGNESWDNAFLFNTQPSIIDDDANGVNDIRDIPNASAQNFDVEDRYTSLFGRLQYDYREKYIVSAMVRRDVSTRFGPNNRVGYFPSFSGAWVIHNEDFINGLLFSNLKLRGSWGITGNDKIGSFRWIGNLQGTNGEATYPFADILSFGNAIGVLSNPDLQWETNFQTNLGLDVGFFDNNLNVTFDYFDKRTEDLLLVIEASSLTGSAAGGSGNPFANAGTVENTGFEFGINYTHEFTDDISLRLDYNLTTINNNVLEVNNQAGFISGGLFGLNQQPSRMQTGLPLGVFYGLQTDGVFQTQAEIDALAVDRDGDGNLDEYQPGAAPGDLKYVDVDGNGYIEFGSDNDFTSLGDPIPDFTMGGGFNLNVNKFDFGASFYASFGNEIVRGYERFITYSNKLSLYNGRWTGPGTSNEIPRASTNAANNQLFSSFYVEDGSFFRIQNVQLGYTLDDTQIKGISTCRIYVAANNIYTFTKYRGYDPDISNQSPIGAGVDLGQYPQARMFITGIKVSF
ncbi:SusC/RagA family TonB-linked outer membrane protein [Tenacibaculum sp. M341]|uniref:SusC/RagA family TonB-linked outer membrane protein n=1 Tax=Tenacibaculum sp. M341 TaxID=2530339 RepID=UPI00104D0D5F|nr:TonB-dependent receptor [Tenacibaculum sp. M341]TCI90652.1 TonB-dependent receptor [Tenacibaculum sp. M341]